MSQSMLSEGRRPSSCGRPRPETVVGASKRHASSNPEEVVFTFLPNGEGGAEEILLTFKSLDEQAAAVASQLRRRVAPGARAVLLLPPGPDFIVGFFGCLYAGVVAVPTPLPHPGQRATGILRLVAIAEDAQPEVVLSTRAIRSMAEPMTSSIPELQDVAWVDLDALGESEDAEWEPCEVSLESLAFLQYTSGSTGQPKGVMITHGNLLHNLAAIHRTLGLDETAVVVGWLPPYHDMGLISMIILPVLLGVPATLMPTVAFLQDPVRWLRAISAYRGTASAAPNFAFDFCVRRVSERDLSGLDLSSWRVVANGAEPIRADSIARFAETFAPCGFRPDAIRPVYGLAESTLLATGVPPGERPVWRAFDAAELRRGVARSASQEDGSARTLVSCGTTFEQEMLIVDPVSLERCTEGVVGEIWVSGESVAAGYWQRPALTREVFEASPRGEEGRRFLRTGDLGFVSSEGLFVVGRIKDVIIVAGRNHHPQDIERTAERSDPRIRPGCVAAFGVEGDEGEVVVVALEVRSGTHGDPAAEGEVVNAVRRDVMQGHQLAVKEVVLLPPGTLPKTSSGKLQRSSSRHEYLAGRGAWCRGAGGGHD